MILPVVILALAGVAAEDLKTVAAEPNPVKRARLALVHGEHAATKAGEACQGSEYDQCNQLLSEAEESVELASQSLDRAGIDAARNPRHHKDAEIKTRKILRLVDALRSYIHPEDLVHYEAVRKKVSDINDRLLSAIMSKKKK